MLKIIALSLVLVSPAYVDVFSCVQRAGRTVLQSMPCKNHHVARTLPTSDSRAVTPRPEDMKFTNNKGQQCRFEPPHYVKLVCEEGSGASSSR
jgi:hypothetical protein